MYWTPDDPDYPLAQKVEGLMRPIMEHPEIEHVVRLLKDKHPSPGAAIHNAVFGVLLDYFKAQK